MEGKIQVSKTADAGPPMVTSLRDGYSSKDEPLERHGDPRDVLYSLSGALSIVGRVFMA